MFLGVRIEPWVAMAKNARITTKPMSGRKSLTAERSKPFLASAAPFLGSSAASFEVAI